MGAEKRMTARFRQGFGGLNPPSPRLWRVKVRRWGKSSPVLVATPGAVCTGSCKTKYILRALAYNGPLYFSNLVGMLRRGRLLR